MIEWIDELKHQQNKTQVIVVDNESDEEKSELEDENGIMNGDKCTFPKYHYWKHIIPQTINYGSAKNFDGECSKSNHKYLTRKSGSRTQGRIDTFDEQTSYNLSSKIVIDCAFDHIHKKSSMLGKMSRQTI